MDKKLINKDLIQSKNQVQSKSESETQTKDMVQVKNNKSSSSHDEFFKESYSEPELVRELLSFIFPLRGLFTNEGITLE